MKQKKAPTWLFLLIVTVISATDLEILVRGASKPAHLILAISTVSLAGSLLSLALQRWALAHWTVMIGAALSAVAVVIS